MTYNTMTTASRVQAVAAFRDYLDVLYSTPEDDEDETEGAGILKSILDCYLIDLQRKDNGLDGDDSYFLRIKLSSAMAASLFEDHRAEHSSALANWYHGKSPASLEELVANLLSESILNFAESILEMRRYLVEPDPFAAPCPEMVDAIYRKWAEEDLAALGNSH
jgi:hypothetical protein